MQYLDGPGNPAANPFQNLQGLRRLITLTKPGGKGKLTAASHPGYNFKGEEPINRPKPRVLLLAAACNPYKGSDFAAGWGRALETAKHYDTWVICGHWDRPDIQDFLAEQGEISGLHFCFLESWWVEEFLKIGRPLYYLHYLPYNLWQRRAFKLALRLNQEFKFDLVHQVTIVGYREPGYLWQLGIPFIWGPVGGTQNYPWRFLKAAGVAGALKEGLRSAINILQFRFSPRVRRAVRQAAALIAANSEIQGDFSRVHGIRTAVLLETGLFSVEPVETRGVGTRDGSPLKILWSGQLIHRKALHLLLRALAGLPAGSPYTLKVLGNGPLETRWQNLAQQLGIDQHCGWLGWVPQAQALREYHWADVLVFTSLRDTSGNVVLEAMSQGVPVVCLDHQGMHDIVTTESGIKIPVTTPEEVIAGLRETIRLLSTDQERLKAMSAGALKRARCYLWSRNQAEMAKFYQAVLARSQSLPETSST